MKKRDIINLVNVGALDISSHTLSVGHAYKVVKFRKALRAAISAINEDTDAIRQSEGITDAKAFDNELLSLRGLQERTPEQQARLDDMEAKINRFYELRGEMLQEPVELEGVKALPYDQWRLLQAENRDRQVGDRKVDVLSGGREDLLEGILWQAPEDDRESS